MFDRANIIEIVDADTGEVISETGRVGRVLITNLTRKLMPIIRYPAGDLAMWMESAETPYRKFKLQGRSDEAARLGTISVYFEDTRTLVMKTLGEVKGLQFQMILNHFNHKDELILRIAGQSLRPDEKIVERVIEAFKNDKPVYPSILSKNLIHPLKVEIVDMHQLEGNLRTGKLKRVIDKRIKT
jgi:phenylacetate-CoA ligase